MKDVTPERLRGTRWMLWQADDGIVYARDFKEGYRTVVGSHILGWDTDHICSYLDARKEFDKHVQIYAANMPAEEREYMRTAIGAWQREYNTCNHEFVNVAFTHIKMVCKHCDQEQT